jgi:hypothetical protein
MTGITSKYLKNVNLLFQPVTACSFRVCMAVGQLQFLFAGILSEKLHP